MEKQITNTEDKIWVTVTRKVNLGNYESAEVQAGYSKTVGEGENPLELIQEAEKELTPFVNKKSVRIKKRKRKAL